MMMKKMTMKEWWYFWSKLIFFQYLFFKYFSNLQKIENHNKLYRQGLVTFKMGVNHLTDLVCKFIGKINFLNKFLVQKRIQKEEWSSIRWECDPKCQQIYGTNECWRCAQIDGLAYKRICHSCEGSS